MWWCLLKTILHCDETAQVPDVSEKLFVFSSDGSGAEK
jgi:hypothetical protein